MGRLDAKAPAPAALSARGQRWQRHRPPGRPRSLRRQREQQQQPPLLCLRAPRQQQSQQQRQQQQQQLRPRNVNGRLVAGLRAPHNTTQFLMCDEYKRERLSANRVDAAGPPRDVGDLDGYARSLARARGGAWGLVPIFVPGDWRADSAAGSPSLADADYEPKDEDWARIEDFMERDFAAVYREMLSV